MKLILGVSACPMGVAHTYLAADSIEEAGKDLGYQVKVETQGASGIENKLSSDEIEKADLIVIASAVKLAGSDRFQGYEDKILKIDLQSAIRKSKQLISERLAQVNQ
ncbi:PTS fructose transporter subunit IIB [Sporolactobacillus sp. THM7-4]|nr:PTS fructose transporter subunit IIB [Sporolactobacillus sp. THM7-4]